MRLAPPYGFCMNILTTDFGCDKVTHYAAWGLAALPNALSGALSDTPDHVLIK